MTTLFSELISSVVVSSEFALQPGQSAVYLADTADLDGATLSLEQSANGTVWERARDQAGVLVPNLVGSAGAETSTAILRNERTEATRYRAVLIETLVLGGAVLVTFTSAADPTTIDKVTIVTDEGIEFLVPISGPGSGSPAGVSGSIQINLDDVLAAAPDLRYDPNLFAYIVGGDNGYIEFVGADGDTNSVGASFIARGGAGDGTEAGGDVTIEGGVGGAAGIGGRATVAGGMAASGSNSDGGLARVVGGTGDGTGVGGDVQIFSGQEGIGGTAGTVKLGTGTVDRITLSGTASASTGVQFNGYGAGTITSDASGNLTAVSDITIKRDIRPYTRGLADLLQLEPISYGYTLESRLDQTKNDYAGFSAQDVAEVFPEAIDRGAEGLLSFSDRPILAALVNSIKELNAEITRLKRPLWRRLLGI